MAAEAPVCYYPSLFTPSHSLMSTPQATFRANTPLHLPETSSRPQSSKKSIQPVAEAQGTWPTMIPIDQRSRGKARTSNPLRYGRNRCPTTPGEVCELLIKKRNRALSDTYSNELQVAQPMRIFLPQKKKSELDKNRRRS